MTNKRGQISRALGSESCAQYGDYQMLVSTTVEYRNVSTLVWDKLQALGILYNYPTAQPDSSLPDPSLRAPSPLQTVKSLLAPCLATM